MAKQQETDRLKFCDIKDVAPAGHGLTGGGQRRKNPQIPRSREPETRNSQESFGSACCGLPRLGLATTAMANKRTTGPVTL